MFITENQNVGDSVLFLLSSREALANIVEATGTENASELIDFIYNEASDYEVMHLLVNGSLPEEKYNAVAEMILFSEFKESMMMNKDFVEEMVGDDLFYNILHEVDSLYMATSTARPVVEFAAETDLDVAISLMVSEAAGGNPGLAALAKKKAKLAGGKGAAIDATMKRAAAKKAAVMKAKMAGGKGAAINATMKNQAAKAAKVHQSKAAFMAKGDAARAAAEKSAKALADKKKMHAATSNVSLKAKAYALKHKVMGAGKDLIAKGSKLAAKHPAAAKAAAVTGGAAGAALAIYAGAKVYKRFFGQAAKACGGMSGAAKTQCMGKYKKGAIMKQAAAIQSASGSCAKAGNPEKCKAGIAKKIQSLKAKAAKIAA